MDSAPDSMARELNNHGEGLEGVVAARTSISLIKGEEGELRYRGYSIDDLAEHASFEEVVHLLWHGDLPNLKQLDGFDRQLKSARTLDREVLAFIEQKLRSVSPPDALRTVVSYLGGRDPDANDSSEAANLRKGLRLAASLPAIAASHYRISCGLEAIDPDSSSDRSQSHAEHLLHVLGVQPTDSAGSALNVAMVVQADHGFNASTFSARVTAGTLADLHSAVTAAIATLKGPLHGGATKAVFEFIEGAGDRRKIRDAVDRALKSRRLVPGFGHRVYKTIDPRTRHLKNSLQRLIEAGADDKWFQWAEALEDAMARRKQLVPNLDLYLAPLYLTIGIPVELFTSMFACARVAGWVAHVAEQHSDNRLIRPIEEYIGPLSRPYRDLKERE